MAAYQRIVVKLGTSTLTAGSPHLNTRRMLSIVTQAAALHEQGREIVVVSSGAIAAGRAAMVGRDLGRNLPAKQMLAAIGQPQLMQIYRDLFAIFEIEVAQILLTAADFRNRQRYLNARDTVEGLLAHRIVPIVNENDSVATDEIKVGDNDNLSALVANLVNADLLALLTDQPGLLTGDPRHDPDAELIPYVDDINTARMAAGSSGAQGTGGMATKIDAAQLAIRSGTAVVIAEGSRPDILLDLISDQGQSTGTWFEPTGSAIESRKRWMLSEQAQGVIRVDAGAAKHLKAGNSSLLPVGVTGVEGQFERGVVVRIVGPDGTDVARGLAHYAAEEVRQIAGLHSAEIVARLGYTSGDEIVHREDLVIL